MDTLRLNTDQNLYADYYWLITIMKRKQYHKWRYCSATLEHRIRSGRRQTGCWHPVLSFKIVTKYDLYCKQKCKVKAKEKEETVRLLLFSYIPINKYNSTYDTVCYKNSIKRNVKHPVSWILGDHFLIIVETIWNSPNIHQQ